MLTAPIAVAFVAGGLATVNPCGFALLPAFLAYYIGADQTALPAAGTRVAQGLRVGVLVALGFLAVFAAVGLPISLGALRLTRALPWAGMALAAVMTAVGVRAAMGHPVGLHVRRSPRVGSGRDVVNVVLFGVAYGVASLGCTLPVFLAVVSASLATSGASAALTVLIAYGVGAAVVVTALAVAAALARRGLAGALRRLVPHMPRLAGALLILAGGYLGYYWARVQFASVEELSHDPVVAGAGRFISFVEREAASNGWIVMTVALVVVAGALAAALAHPGRRRVRADVAGAAEPVRPHAARSTSDSDHDGRYHGDPR